jgi:hypothetical protein
MREKNEAGENFSFRFRTMIHVTETKEMKEIEMGEKKPDGGMFLE